MQVYYVARDIASNVLPIILNRFRMKPGWPDRPENAMKSSVAIIQEGQFCQNKNYIFGMVILWGQVVSQSLESANGGKDIMEFEYRKCLALSSQSVN